MAKQDFSSEQKAQLALESLMQHNGKEICEREGITPNLLTRWENELKKNAKSIYDQVDAAADRIALLEQLLGRYMADQEMQTLTPHSARQRQKASANGSEREPVPS